MASWSMTQIVIAAFLTATALVVLAHWLVR